MNKFIYELLPRCHALIYKAFLQTSGRDIIPKIIDYLELNYTQDEIADKIGFRLSHDLYRALGSLTYIKKNKFLNEYKKSYKFNTTIPIEEDLEGIILQIVQNNRWSKQYSSDQPQYDLILAIPKWSRVITISTSEILPIDILKNVKQLDILKLNNYQMYNSFNKLHGLKGRSVCLQSITNMNKIVAMQRLGFMKKNIRDLKMITKSANLHLFTLIPDISRNLRLGLFFQTVVKIDNVKDVIKDAGVDPYNYIITISDPSGIVDCRFNIYHKKYSLWDKLKSKWLHSELNQYYNIPMNEDVEFNNPHDLKKINANFLILGNWYLGDNMPNISMILPIYDSSNRVKYSIIEYMNVRKKISYDTFEKLFNDVNLNDMMSDKIFMQNIIIDNNSKMIYYKESDWNSKIFLLLLKNNFKKPALRIRIGFGVKIFNKMYNDIIRYMNMNNDHKSLYLSNDIESTIKTLYTQNYDDESELDVDLEIFIPVKLWKLISQLIPDIIKCKYTYNDLFNWNNGGNKLKNMWERKHMKNYTQIEHVETYEIKSSLSYIFQARGIVFIPETLHDKIK